MVKIFPLPHSPNFSFSSANEINEKIYIAPWTFFQVSCPWKATSLKRKGLSGCPMKLPKDKRI